MSQYSQNNIQGLEHEELPEELAVAIIGMSGVFPGAADVKSFWNNLAEGKESITTFEREDLIKKGVDEALLDNEAYVKAGSFIEDVEYFDAEFFDMTPREAQITDPQHRVLLECAHQALENAGYVGENYDGAIGVFAGVGLNTYLLTNLMPNTKVLEQMGMHQLLLGNDKCYATSRISYKLNLKGPSMSIDTACSSSLVSIITAYKQLISYDCDMALAGGAKVNSSDTGYIYEPGSINSPDGHCRTFDADASGTVFGSGAAMVLMKRLEDAIEDNDNIIGIVRGGAINNDGSDKVGFTAPSVNRQRDVIEQALTFTEIEAETISYVEAHGTGTRLGDPVELGALSDAFEGVENQSCYIGSSKTNIGHLESAAGVTGLVKVLSALEHQQLPPTLNFKTANPAIDFANSPFKVVSESTPWPRTDIPRRACVSSFGLGGTNAHVIVEEPPVRVNDSVEQSELLVLSTKNAESLNVAKTQLADAISVANAPSAKDAAFTLATGRREFATRTFAVANKGEAINFAASVNADKTFENIAFVIPGQGTQHLGMCRDLVNRFDTYNEVFEQCCEVMEKLGNTQLKGLLLADAHVTESTTKSAQPSQIMLSQTVNAQPAIFIHALAMAKQMIAYGIEPSVMLGHSLGEYVCACIAGVLSIEDALKLVNARATLMNKVPAGSMAVLSTNLSQVNELIAGLNVDIAAINALRSIVVSGETTAIEAVLAKAADANVDARQLVTSHAFHSSMMDSILAEFKAVVAKVSFFEPQIEYISSYNGKVLDAQTIANPDYWVNHLRHTVQFGDAVANLLDKGVDCFFDLGPSTTAAMLVRDNLTVDFDVEVINCAANVKQTTNADAALLTAIGQFWSLGGDIDWQLVYQGRDCYRAALPGYPLQKQKHWVEPLNIKPAQVEEQVVAETPDNSNVVPMPVANNSYEGAPRNETEQLIVSAWQELLGIEEIHYQDNFFNLGGQSLLATRVMSFIYEQIGVELDVSVIFDNPTVEGLAIAVMEQQMLATQGADSELEQLLAQMEA